MYKLETELGTLAYRQASMIDVDLAVANWKAEHKPPTMPKKREVWTARETGKLTTNAMRKYGKLPGFLPNDIKQALKDKIIEELPMIDNPHDKDYQQGKKDYANRVYQVHFTALLVSSICEGQDQLLAYIVMVPELRQQLYRSIIEVSTITPDLVHNCIAAMDRFYKGEPFIETLENRSNKKDNDLPVDSFRHSMDDLFISNSMLEYAHKLPIKERGMLAAQLMVKAYKEYWNYEDEKANVTATKGSGFLRNALSRS